MAVKAKYSGPFYGLSDPDHRGPDHSAYIVALKRALVRWTGGTGLLKWQPGGRFNGEYNVALEHDVKLFKHARKLDSAKWVWGSSAHTALTTAIRGGGTRKPPTPIQPALDTVAVGLMEDAWYAKHPGLRNAEKVHASIASYLLNMENNRSRWHYRQQRPMHSLGVVPANGGSDDCSSLCVAALYWARKHTGVPVPDPAGYGYSGYGNTVSLYTVNRSRKLSLSGEFEVGDIGLYGPYATRHAVICRQRGSVQSAIWTSHGSEAGPYPVKLLYRGDFFAAVRPKLAV